MDLLADPPANPDISKGYLDLLKGVPDTDAAPPKNTGAIQAVWASGLGSMFYDNAAGDRPQGDECVAAADRLAEHPAWRHRARRRVADRATSPPRWPAPRAPTGLPGLDISEPMLARAVSAQAGPNVGFLRADANSFHCATRPWTRPSPSRCCS